MKEQKYIVYELESKLTVCDKIEEAINQSLKQAGTLKQSILKKAFEGKLVTAVVEEQRETKVHNMKKSSEMHVSTGGRNTLLCAVCHSDELPLSELKGYEGMCVACECENMNNEFEKQIENELSIYEKRTGEKLDFNEFYYECQAGNVDKANLKRLPELKSCYEDAMMEIRRYEAESRQGRQLEINFYENDLPF